MTLDDIRIILCRPSESGNIGAVCRAMKNMGLKHLRIVSPELPPDEEVILARSVHAQDIWLERKNYDSLALALADCALAVGTTRRRGGKRKERSLSPGELARELSERIGKTALVFGNERTGLSTSELELCNLASHIPVDEDFPSLNLSHAVQIYTYELHQALSTLRSPQGSGVEPIDRERRDNLVQTMTDSLASIGFYKQPGRDLQETFFRDMLARAGLSEDESGYLENIFRKMARLSTAAQKQKQP